MIYKPSVSRGLFLLHTQPQLPAAIGVSPTASADNMKSHLGLQGFFITESMKKTQTLVCNEDAMVSRLQRE
jgi:hypothetical protein